jgi:hypothetical protein
MAGPKPNRPASNEKGDNGHGKKSPDQHNPQDEGIGMAACQARGGTAFAAGADAYLTAEIAVCAGNNCAPPTNFTIIDGLF